MYLTRDSLNVEITLVPCKMRTVVSLFLEIIQVVSRWEVLFFPTVIADVYILQCVLERGGLPL